jgi:hypothetical protein
MIILLVVIHFMISFVITDIIIMKYIEAIKTNLSENKEIL